MKSGVLVDALGKVGGLAKQVGQTVAQAPKEIVKTTAKQVGIEIPEGVENKKGIEKIGEKNQATNTQKEQEQFIKDLYGGGANPTTETPQMPQAAMPNEKTIKEEQQKAIIKQQLHAAYFEQLNNPIKRQEEAQKGQERASERVDRLEMEDLQKKQEDDKNKKPIAVTNAANKTESQPGAG